MQYIVPIVALFQGRVVDTPVQTTARTKYFTGGEVEHEIFMMGGTLFFIIELKHNSPYGTSLTQLFLELLSAAQQNTTLNFAGSRIYGLLTDLSQFKFYSYNPTTKQFFFDETIVINVKRTNAFSDMIDVSNKIFGVVLSGYMEGLRATIKSIQEKEKHNDQTRQNYPSPAWELSELPEKGKNAGGPKSTDLWEGALLWAEHCCAKFGEPVTSLQDIEDKTNDALELLVRR